MSNIHGSDTRYALNSFIPIRHSSGGGLVILETRHLHLVLAVAEHGTLTQAARHLDLTQSALSHQLLQLEGRLRLPLFHRLGKRMVPTAAGERLLETARRVVPELRQAEDALRGQAAGRTAVIRLSTECYTCYHWLPPVLGPFRARHPGIEVQIVPDATRNPVAALLDARIDLGIVHTEEPDPRLHYIPLFQDEIVLVAAPWHPLARRSHVRPADLASEHLITYDLRPEVSSTVRQFLAQDGVSPARLSSIQLTEAIVEMAKAGIGVTILARWAVQPHLDAGTLAAVRLGRGGLTRRWHAVILERRPPPYLRQFIEMLAAGPALLSSGEAVSA
jgi:LysR family transcriptional regulator, regulator for metE and metH